MKVNSKAADFMKKVEGKKEFWSWEEEDGERKDKRSSCSRAATAVATSIS